MDEAKLEQFNLGDLKAAQDVLWAIALSEDCIQIMQKQAEKMIKILDKAIENIRAKNKKSYYDLQRTIDQLRKIQRK